MWSILVPNESYDKLCHAVAAIVVFLTDKTK